MNKLITTVYFDVDSTLVLWPEDAKALRFSKEIYEALPDVVIKDPYVVEGPYNCRPTHLCLKVHTRHVQDLKDCHAEGSEVVVWSAGGKLWAQAVVKALELEPYVTICLSKPEVYYDDLPVKEWFPMANRWRIPKS